MVIITTKMVISKRFLELILRDENARKIFGQRELKIIEKQLWGLTLTQSEKNRLSQDIRKKFAFIQKCSKYEEMFTLKKGLIVQQIIRETIETILEDKLALRIGTILLFGSTATNTRNVNSDIDIAVVFDTMNSKEATLFRKRLLGKLHEIIDLQVYNVLPEKICREIDLHKRIIWEK